MPEMSINKFVDDVILNEMNKIINEHGFHYLGFILVANAIEFVGAFLDEEDFDRLGLSRERFNKLIEEYFPEKYRQYTERDSDNNLYKNLRCGMLHVMVPKIGVALTHREESKHYNTQHLALDGNGRVVLVIEDLYNDLCKAIEKMRSDRFRSNIKKDLSEPYLSIP